ncbi:hypothetical protein ACFQ6N_35450 [Kitasatospora sp. NPDC056446]|uniref:hypothetical protein n=1 Tax=Kitasatospora sp. NPDC056446 TaxID=3345819 RepID=UPI0036B1F254
MEALSIETRVSHGQFCIKDPDVDVALDVYAGLNGLIQTRGGENRATILTGISTGKIALTYAPCQAEPALHLDGWDDVVEVSMTFATRRAGFVGHGFQDDPITDLPSLSAAGAGSYRLRVHARGRNEDLDLDLDLEDNYGDLVEFYLVQAWPNPVVPEIRYKLTDRRGEYVRTA